MTDKPENSLDEVVRADGRYPLDAFAFLHDGLARVRLTARAPTRLPLSWHREVTHRKQVAGFANF